MAATARRPAPESLAKGGSRQPLRQYYHCSRRLAEGWRRRGGVRSRDCAVQRGSLLFDQGHGGSVPGVPLAVVIMTVAMETAKLVTADGSPGDGA